MHQLHAFALDFFNHDRQDFLLLLFFFGQKHQAGAVKSFFGDGNALQQDEFMGYLQHDASAVASLVACLGTPVLHVFQHAQGLIHQFVTFAAVYVHHHAHAAGVMLHICSVESFVCHSCLYDNVVYLFVNHSSTRCRASTVALRSPNAVRRT